MRIYKLEKELENECSPLVVDVEGWVPFKVDVTREADMALQLFVIVCSLNPAEWHHNITGLSDNLLEITWNERYYQLPITEKLKEKTSTEVTNMKEGRHSMKVLISRGSLMKDLAYVVQTTPYSFFARIPIKEEDKKMTCPQSLKLGGIGIKAYKDLQLASGTANKYL